MRLFCTIDQDGNKMKYEVLAYFNGSVVVSHISGLFPSVIYPLSEISHLTKSSPDGGSLSYTCECGFIVAVGEKECMNCKTPRVYNEG